MLFLDGVYVEWPDGMLFFRWVKAPSGDDRTRFTRARKRCTQRSCRRDAEFCSVAEERRHEVNPAKLRSLHEKPHGRSVEYNTAATESTPKPLIIDRQIRWEILRLLSSGLGMLILVFIGYSAAEELGRAAEGRVEVSAAMALIGLKTLIVLEVLLPSALFFSILATIGRMHRDGETLALYAAGVRPTRIIGSVATLSLVIALITALISISGRPWAYRESYRIEAEAAASFDLRKISSGRFVTLESVNFTTLIADALDLEHGQHRGVFLHRNHQGEDSRSEIIVAEAAELFTLNPEQAVAAKFYNGYHYSLDNSKRQDVTARFKELTANLRFEEARATYRRKAEPTSILAMSRKSKDIAEFQWRISTPVATLLLALMAVPLARSKPRESRFRIIFLAIALYIGVFSMAAVARTLIEQSKIGSTPGLWTVHLVLVLVLLGLLKARI